MRNTKNCNSHANIFAFTLIKENGLSGLHDHVCFQLKHNRLKNMHVNALNDFTLGCKILNFSAKRLSFCGSNKVCFV